MKQGAGPLAASVGGPTPTPTIRWGIIGVGDVCEVKSGPAFQKSPGSALVAVMRRNGALAEDFARRHGVPRFYTDAAALLDDEEVDAVYIATPPETHRDYALMCCAKGKPVLVEKPMARSAAECREMIEAFRQRELPLFVAYYRRHLPKFEAVRRLLQEGKLGTITEVRLSCTRPAPSSSSGNTTNWRLDAKVGGGGLFLDLGSHMLDLVDWLLGSLRNTKGVAARLHQSQPAAGEHEGRGPSSADVEDNVRLVFSTPGGALGSGTWNFASSLSEDEVRIVGTRGHMSFAVFDNGPIRLRVASPSPSPSSHEMKEEVIGPFDAATPAHVHQPLVEAVVRDLQGYYSGEGPRKWTPADEARAQCQSTASSALRASEAMDAALRDYYGGSRNDAFWARPETWGNNK